MNAALDPLLLRRPTARPAARAADAAGAGLRILSADARRGVHDREQALALLQGLDLAHWVRATPFGGTPGPAGFALSLKPGHAARLTSDHDTLSLCATLGLDTVRDPLDLERETVLAMLLCPQGFAFPSVDEWQSQLRMRAGIVNAARRTVLDFHTTEAERPADCWTYAEDRGFTVLPGRPLAEALRKATQPAPGATPYAFSCYRATEYVIQLAIAEEAERCHPALLARLQRQAETRAVMSGRFHDVFLHEHGSLQRPLPLRCFVPGDRTWFRNPDEASADVSGFEGSWVIYLGDGLFSNFWQRDKPFSYAAKCVEVHHWRHGTWRDAGGELQMDESEVARRVQATMAEPAAFARVMGEMARLREPQGVYGSGGGCIDASREHPRCVRPGSCEIELPDLK